MTLRSHERRIRLQRLDPLRMWRIGAEISGGGSLENRWRHRAGGRRVSNATAAVENGVGTEFADTREERSHRVRPLRVFQLLGADADNCAGYIGGAHVDRL